MDEPERPTLAGRVPDPGSNRCHYVLGDGNECGVRALQHVLYVVDGQAWTSTACYLHVPASREVEGYTAHHYWTTRGSDCDVPFATWVHGQTEGNGWCVADRDETDAELAEILQHGTVPSKTDP